jgi:hypothetical protein
MYLSAIALNNLHFEMLKLQNGSVDRQIFKTDGG